MKMMIMEGLKHSFILLENTAEAFCKFARTSNANEGDVVVLTSNRPSEHNNNKRGKATNCDAASSSLMRSSSELMISVNGMCPAYLAH